MPTAAEISLRDVPAEAQCECWRSRLWNKAKRVDRAFLSIAIVITALYAYSPALAGRVLWAATKSLLFLSPYLILAYAAAAYMKAASVEMVVTRVFRGKTWVMILTASALGAFSPFCSCTVVPVIAVLLRAGMPLSAIFAFWLSSPLMSPDIYVLTAGVIGPGFANARLVSAAFIGLSAGVSTLALQRFGFLENPLSAQLLAAGPLEIAGEGRAVDPVWKFWREASRREIFRSVFFRTALLLTKWLAFAFLLESLMVELMPPDLLKGWLGSTSRFGIPIAALIGIPTYLNSMVATPFLKGLMATGMSPGAALAFTVAGGMTSVPAILAVFPMVRRGVLAWYLTIAVCASLICGYAYQWIWEAMH